MKFYSQWNEIEACLLTLTISTRLPTTYSAMSRNAIPIENGFNSESRVFRKRKISAD